MGVRQVVVPPERHPLTVCRWTFFVEHHGYVGRKRHEYSGSIGLLTQPLGSYYLLVKPSCSRSTPDRFWNRDEEDNEDDEGTEAEYSQDSR
ncbi:hypothetical protein GCM10022627_10050 [Haloarcula argentinensis]|uniref:Uncharacterized protein n=1 Tax=Haloarcula argentinensis TaxID=43776 RepID=A0A830FEL3_HALAR|nr:hypothetical protein GCM10009006_09340 [Haloarcula argentinensis]